MLDDSEPVPISLTYVHPAVAQLGFGGAGHVRAATLGQRIRAYDVVTAVDPEAQLTGFYTEYGDVRPLLRVADDRFVLMAHGDELVLEFPAPPRPPGTSRHVFLQADVFYTLKHHPFGVLTTTLDPLPYHGMEAYPYPPEDWPYRDDADYAAYQRAWNTRPVGFP
jgi:hypothetical protein